METLALIAGDGRLPLELARAARARSQRLIGLGFRGITAPELERECDGFVWLVLGQLAALLDAAGASGAAAAVVGGKVSKSHLLRPGAAPVQPDALALEVLSGLKDRRDDALLGALAARLEAAGLPLLPQAALVPDLLLGAGLWTPHEPDAGQHDDVALGWRVARALGGLDIGQCAVVRGGAVLALEAIEGTDAAIRRAGTLGGPGGRVVKVAKPAQDPRFDLPTIGLGTLEAMAEAGADLLAFEAGRTLVLDREPLLAGASAAGIVVLGVPPEGPA